MEEQTNCGIDIPTDGEIRRENYIHYHCRRLQGFDFTRLTQKKMRAGSWTGRVPTITNEIRGLEHFLTNDWKIAQSATKNPVKITLPGPVTIADSTANDYYKDERSLGAALADALNFEIRALADAGCRHIQVDEPVFARETQKALDYGIEHLERCFHKVPKQVVRTTHICCGYPDKLDREDYAKAPPDAYFQLAETLDLAQIDAVSIEDAHCHNDLKLLEYFKRTKIIFGAVAIACSRIETTEEIRDRLRAALEHIDAPRLLAAPDCGLGMLNAEQVRSKLTNLVAAAKSL